MSILSQDLDQTVDSEVKLADFLKRHNPGDFDNGSWIGTSFAPVLDRTPERSKVDAICESCISIKGDMLDITNTLNVVAKGNIHWEEYGINKVKAPAALSFKPWNGQYIPKEIEAKWVGVNINTCGRFSNHKITCEKFQLTGTFIGTDSEMSDCELNCRTMLLNDMPQKFANITGHVDVLRITCISLSDVDDYFGNHVIEQRVGPKRISKITDIRAFFNNSRKYNKFWVDPWTLYDANALIAAMGLGDLDLSMLQLRDCNFVMTFNRDINKHWMMTGCAPT